MHTCGPTQWLSNLPSFADSTTTIISGQGITSPGGLHLLVQ